MVAKVQVDWKLIDQPEPILSRFSSRRSVVYGTKGIVSCSQPLAAAAGLEILRKGGNAGLLYFSMCPGQGCTEFMTQPMPLSQHPLL